MPDQEDIERLTLTNFKDGAAIEMFNRALERALTNINDINTTLQARQITLKATLTPAEDRTYVSVAVCVETKLAGQAAEKVTALMGIDERGKGFAHETGRQQRLPFGRKILNLQKGEGE